MSLDRRLGWLVGITGTFAGVASGLGTAEEHVASFPDLELVLTLPALEEMTEESDPEAGGSRTWSGKLGEVLVVIHFEPLDRSEMSLDEPDDARDAVAWVLNRTDPLFSIDTEYFIEDEAYGYAPYAAVFEADRHEDGEDAGRTFILGGLLEEHGYVVSVECHEDPDEATAEAVRDFLRNGIRYEGSARRDPQWTAEEIEARWVRDTPAFMHEDFLQEMKRPKTAKKVAFRTEHYLVLTNSSGAKLFGRKLEENYDEIVKVFPFEEVEGRRLMPIFLFRTESDYNAFYANITGRSIEEADRSKGHAWRDYYATWYEAPKDPVHIHECTHQIFANRLHLSGGGSWFQEGVAEYIETRENDRNNVARLVENGEATPLREFLLMRSLLHSSEEDVRGGGGAGDNYKQAALFIEFLRESKFGKDGFEKFVQLAGRAEQDLEAIEAVFQRVYGEGLDSIASRFQEYCEKR